VIHKAFIKLDENGTEAAAATAVVVGEKTSAPPPAKVVKIDRPFFFAIRDVPTGTVLFAGRITDPTAK
jgi:serpin B